jgi:hypothetical protein
VGYETLTTLDHTYNITCGAEIQMVRDSSRHFVFAKNQKNNTIDFEKDGIRDLFNSTIKVCDITKFGLYQYPKVNKFVNYTDPSIKMIAPKLKTM